MTASKPATPPASAEPVGRTDLAKVDAHVVQPDEYDELPELTDEMMDRAEVHQGGTLVRRARGRPRLERPKEQVTLRLDATVLDAYRATGPGWQTRMNDALAAGAKRLRKA